MYLIASDKSIGKKIKFKGKTYSIVGLSSFDFSKVKIAFFSAGSSIAEKWAPIAAKKTIVIDNSKHFRMDKDVPLIIPEVNADDLKKVVGIVMTKKEYWDKKTPIELKIGDKKSKGKLCNLPIV